MARFLQNTAVPRIQAKYHSMALVCSLKHKKPVCDRSMLVQIAPNVAHANHKLEVVQGSRMNLRLHIRSILKEARVHSADVSVGMAVEDCSEPTCSTHTYRHA